MTSPDPLPTDAELEILKILWELGPSTVRAVHEAQLNTKPVRYTTVLRLLQNMHDKGLVRRDESARSHVYTSSVPETATKDRYVDDLVDRVFQGSTARLVMRALSQGRATVEELDEMQALLARLEEGHSTNG